jgi:hypothetical protein
MTLSDFYEKCKNKAITEQQMVEALKSMSYDEQITAIKLFAKYNSENILMFFREFSPKYPDLMTELKENVPLTEEAKKARELLWKQYETQTY